jgi:hypothetical protein
MPEPISAILDQARTELCHWPFDEYRAFPGLNASVIVEGRKSLLHVKHAWDHGRADTDAMRFGRLLHCLLFEPREVEKRYHPWEGTRRGNDYVAFFMDAEADGAEVVKAKGEYSLEVALEAVPSFLHNERVRDLIKAGEAECSVICPEGDVQCKGRIDWLSQSEHVLVDLKTTAQIESRLFGQTFFRYNYDIKLGLYRRWVEKVVGGRWPVEVIVQESSPPYDVAVVPIPDAVLDEGAEQGLAIINKVRQAIAADRWPGVADGKPYSLVVPYYKLVEETEEFQG